jgi:hypothetical protein
MLVVGGFESFGCAVGAKDGGGAEHQRRLTSTRQPIGNRRFDRVDDETAADSGSGRHRRVETVDLHHRVACGGSGIQYEIGNVVQLDAIGVL